MNTSKLNDWMQILTSLAVLAGLVLVAYEIRQNTEIAMAEASQGNYSGWTQVSWAELETDIGDIYVKSIEHPENLSSADIFKLSAWYSLIISQFDLDDSMAELGMPGDYAGMSEWDVESYFSSKFSRVWFEENKSWLRAENAKKITRFIGTTPVSTEWDYAERIKAKLK